MFELVQCRVEGWAEKRLIMISILNKMIHMPPSSCLASNSTMLSRKPQEATGRSRKPATRQEHRYHIREVLESDPYDSDPYDPDPCDEYEDHDILYSPSEGSRDQTGSETDAW